MVHLRRSVRKITMSVHKDVMHLMCVGWLIAKRLEEGLEAPFTRDGLVKAAHDGRVMDVILKADDGRVALWYKDQAKKKEMDEVFNCAVVGYTEGGESRTASAYVFLLECFLDYIPKRLSE